MRPMRGARRALTRRVAALRSLILKGDEKALEQLLHVAPANFKLLLGMIKALRAAKEGTPQGVVLDALIGRYARHASKRELKRIRADPLLKKRLADEPDTSDGCSAGFTGQSY